MPPKKANRVPDAAPTPETLPDDIRFFVQITRRIYRDPRWSQKHVPCQAWQVYCWMVDNTTSNNDEHQNEDGEAIRLGIVAGNKEVKFSEIATDINCSWRSVQRSVEWLVAQGFIVTNEKENLKDGLPYRFAVVDSTRKFASDSGSDGKTTIKGRDGKTYTKKSEPTKPEPFDIESMPDTLDGEPVTYAQPVAKQAAKQRSEKWDEGLDEAARDFFSDDRPISSLPKCEYCGKHGCDGTCDDDIS